jgi:hypothetical protein
MRHGDKHRKDKKMHCTLKNLWFMKNNERTPIMVANPHDNGTLVNVEPLLRLVAEFGSIESLADEAQEITDDLPNVLLQQKDDFVGLVNAHNLLVRVRKALS